jgi:hypothetical protein
MTTYILHGGFSKIRNESNDRLYKTIAESVSEGGIVLCTYFSVIDVEKIPERFEGQKQYLIEQSEGKEFRCELAVKESFLEQVAAADAVILNGGSTNQLLEALRQYPELKTVFEGKMIVGSSAGAYALSAYNYDKSHKRMRDGLGLLEIKTVCHFESTTDEHVGQEAIEVMNSEHSELPLVVLKDCEWQSFKV